MDQVVQIVGALLILAAFAGAQFGRLDQSSLSYLWLNLVGSVVLAGLAYYEEQWGFLLLEFVWALVSAWSLTQVCAAASPAPRTDRGQRGGEKRRMRSSAAVGEPRPSRLLVSA